MPRGGAWERKMKNVHDNVLTVVGNTPLVRLNRMTEGLQCNLLAKMEFVNPGEYTVLASGGIRDGVHSTQPSPWNPI